MKKYLFKNKFLFLCNIVTIILVSSINIIQAFLFKYIIDVATKGTTSEFVKVIFAAITFLLFALAIDYSNKVLNSKFIKTSMLTLKEDIFRGILNKNICQFNDNNTSQYISYLTNDIVILEDNYFRSILSMIQQIFLFLFALVSLIKINVYMVIGIFLLGWIPIAIPKIFAKRIKKFKSDYSNNLSIFTTKIKDIFTGFEIIKSFNVENKIKEEYAQCNLSTENSKLKSNIFTGFIDSLTGFSGMIMFLFNMIIAAYFTLNNNMTVGTMMAAVQLMNYIINPLVGVSKNYNRIISVDLIYTDIKNNIESINEDNGTIEKSTFENSIVFKNVTFGYNDDKTILKNINFKLEKNKKYAIIGESGSGKSTILKLLLRYYNNYTGDIYIDDLNFKDIKYKNWYDVMSIIHQNVFMFNSNINDNIDLYQGYDDKKIDESIALSGLTSLINQLPNGKNSLVGENGSLLSGGEKQRISIARTLIKNTPILILDEATSSLDNKTSYNIERSVLKLKDITSIVVTHKLSPELLLMYDHIFVMKDGNIVEQGNFKQLLNMNGYFYNLYNIGKITEEIIEATA